MTNSPTSNMPLVPMSLGDVFDEAFDLYKRNFALIAGVTAGLMIAAVIMAIVAPGAAEASPGMVVVIVILAFAIPVVLVVAGYVFLGVFVMQVVSIEKNAFVNAITRNFHLVQKGFWRVV